MTRRKMLALVLVAAVISLWALTVFAVPEPGVGVGQPPAAAAAGHASIGQRIATYLRGTGLPDAWVVFLISALPIVELRGSIPIGIAVFHMNPWWVFALSIVGNMLPIPFILLLLGPVSKFCMRFGWGRRFFGWLFDRARSKSADVEKYETLGLTVFVAIPLPATGGWTGAMVAFLMGMKFNHSMVSILLGVAIAGVIMTVLSLLGWIGALIAGVALTAMAVGAMSKWLKKEENG
jgi:uncharacterized membrane protein